MSLVYDSSDSSEFVARHAETAAGAVEAARQDTQAFQDALKKSSMKLSSLRTFDVTKDEETVDVVGKSKALLEMAQEL